MVLADYDTKENALPSERFEQWLNHPETYSKTRAQYRRYMKVLEDHFKADLNQIVTFHKRELKKNGLGVAYAFNAFVAYATQPKPEGLGHSKN